MITITYTTNNKAITIHGRCEATEYDSGAWRSGEGWAYWGHCSRKSLKFKVKPVHFVTPYVHYRLPSRGGGLPNLFLFFASGPENKRFEYTKRSMASSLNFGTLCQPIASADGDTCNIFYCIIYNYYALTDAVH